MTPLISLLKDKHKGEERIFLKYAYNEAINNQVRKLPGVRWSQTRKMWHCPINKEVVQNISEQCKGIAIVNTDMLKEPLIKRTEKSYVLPLSPIVASKGNEGVRAISSGISANNSNALADFLIQLQLKAYSTSTIRTYVNEFRQLLQMLGSVHVQDLQPAHLKRYLLFCINKGLTENTIHSRLNALKFYYEQVLRREKFFFEIPRPKKPLLLPKLLNEKELGRLFNSLQNKKHKAMLFTAYSAGLRVSEIVNLKIRDIDSQRMQIFIERAKGKKDRYVNLSPVLLDILRAYISQFKPKPKLYLFESDQTGTAYPTRTVQQIFTNAKQAAGIIKEVGIHSLRHSFATHLLDKGTDIKYIKDLLGHFDIRTTERYLHVAKQKLVNICSPLDDLMKSEKIEW